MTISAVTSEKIRSNLSDRLVSRLREAVHDGVYVPGQRLIEIDIATDFDASRGSVREALRRLAAEGIIELIPKRGAVVRKLSIKELADLFRMREALEGLAARQAAERLTSHTLRKKFKSEIDAIELDRPENLGGRFSEANRRLHQLIVDYAENDLLSKTLQQFRLPIVRLQIRASADLAYRTQSCNEHQAIVAALLTADPDAAEAAMRAHLHAASTRVLAIAQLENRKLAA